MSSRTLRPVLDGLYWVPAPDAQALSCTVTRRASRFEPEDREIDLSRPNPNTGAIGFPRNAVPWGPDGLFDDHRVLGAPISWMFTSTLRDWQEEAVQSLVTAAQGSGGICVAGTGSGKTLVLLAAIHRLGRAALVTIDRTELLNDWLAAIEEHTSLRREDIGIVRGPKCPQSELCLGLIQSLARRQYPAAFYDHFGTLAADEVHRLPAETWMNVPGKFPARHRIGATATPQRADGLHRVFELHMGPIVFQAQSSAVPMDPAVYIIETAAAPPPERYLRWTKDGRGRWHQGDASRADSAHDSRLESLLARDEHRNWLIAEHVARAAAAGRRILLLARRHDLVDALEGLLVSWNVDCAVFTGRQKVDERRRLRSRQVLLATHGVADTGMNIPELDCLVLASGVACGKTLVLQAAGRIRRSCEGKPQPIILDFTDVLVPRCALAGVIRKRVYRDQGWSIRHIRSRIREVA